MPEKDPTSYAWLTYAWVVALSALGGFVSFASKVRDGAARKFNVVELLGELCTSAFVGILTFWLCEWGDVKPLLTAAFVGISGHMGSRAIFKLESMVERFFDSRIGK